ncbi:Major Facilitator Superfamily protein [Arboricoccus pini]|uniref:Major Facilitator Superfamily protein n=1 Tax=Arboricoccus pini TaxID=1963835 RepID=A0A212RNK6_9PROT|nr:MFS transporter [Arboricoccus pini]SNB73973.1 Major Facilitator Superfamily protein [Arboricoccus pini]
MTQTLAAASGTTRRDWLQLFAACLTGLLIPLCFTGPAVVLPSISQELGGTALQLNWVVNAYILTYGSAMMAAGSLADTYGRKRVWLVGLALFALVTFAIPLSPSVGWIDGLRLAQGLGGAAAFAGAMSSLAQTFHGPIRTRVFSLLGTTFGIGLAFGPLASGWLVEIAGWGWVFLTTALIGVAGFALAWTSATESRDPDATGLDWPGAISFTAALTLFTYGILLAPEEGWRSATVIGSLLIAALLSVAFVRIERRVARPMLDLSLFAGARFVGVQVLAASPAFFFVTLIVMLPGRFIGIDGLDALEAGQMMIALAAPLLIVPFLAALLSRWLTSGVQSGIGLLLAGAGLVWLGQVLAGGAGPALMAPLALIGIGIGLPWGLMDGMAVNVVEKERAGMATGIFNCVRVSADGVAIALAGALLAFLIQGGLLGALPASDPTAVIEAANRAALGDIARAGAALPSEQELLLTTYDTAFRWVLYVLAAASALTALLVFALLGRSNAHDGTKGERA